jgi:hypothetical protein
VIDWLRQLDSMHTNAGFGLSRTLAVDRGACVACARNAAALNANGLCDPVRRNANPTTRNSSFSTAAGHPLGPLTSQTVAVTRQVYLAGHNGLPVTRALITLST